MKYEFSSMNINKMKSDHPSFCLRYLLLCFRRHRCSLLLRFCLRYHHQGIWRLADSGFGSPAEKSCYPKQLCPFLLRLPSAGADTIFRSVGQSHKYSLYQENAHETEHLQVYPSALKVSYASHQAFLRYLMLYFA